MNAIFFIFLIKSNFWSEKQNIFRYFDFKLEYIVIFKILIFNSFFGLNF